MPARRRAAASRLPTKLRMTSGRIGNILPGLTGAWQYAAICAVDMSTPPAEPPVPDLDFDPRPEGFTHWRLSVEGDVARLVMAVQEDRGLAGDYVLKLNNYDPGR